MTEANKQAAASAMSLVRQNGMVDAPELAPHITSTFGLSTCDAVSAARRVLESLSDDGRLVKSARYGGTAYELP